MTSSSSSLFFTVSRMGELALEHGPIFAGLSALVLGTSVTLLQFDSVSRRILSPDRLRIRRRLEQCHRIERAIENQMAIIQNSILETPMDLVTDEEEMEDLVQAFLHSSSSVSSSSSSSAPLYSQTILVGIATDTNTKSSQSFEEWYLHLLIPKSIGSKDGTSQTTEIYGRRIQIPLVPFCCKLAEAFEAKVTSTALCFVADASSGLGTHLIGTIAENCKAGMAVIHEPSWMTTLAYIAERNHIPRSKLERIVLALCRFQAWQVRDPVDRESRTVVFLLPGQSCTSTLLPLLHSVFPCERHVFVYDGCVDSVARGVYLASSPNGKSKKTKSPGIENPTRMPPSITATIPISPLRSFVSSLPYAHALSKLSMMEADIVEAWMSSVDTFLTMKKATSSLSSSSSSSSSSSVKANKNEDEYLPFVCRMGYLLGQTGRLGNGTMDVSDLAMINLLQYMTGSRSRPLKSHVMETALSIFHSLREERIQKEQGNMQSYSMDEAKRRAIEDCVFMHKSILIGDKTLVDTVQPMKEWTLIAAKKVSGCSCCLPAGDDEEDEEEEGEEERDEQKANETTMESTFRLPTNSSLSKPRKNTSANKYVDGKVSFAFDPTKFT